MAKRSKMEDIDIAVDNELEMTPVPIQRQVVEDPTPEVTRISENTEDLINCLRNERIIVRHINKPTGLVKDPKHVLFGGMAENAKKVFTVPLLKSGIYVDVLTSDEKKFLEYVLGLRPNALSVYNKTDNYWSTANEAGFSRVILTKQDVYLDLSNPTDYIKYKVLLANKDRIAPSLEALQNTPKATYEFVLISEEDKFKNAKDTMSLLMQCYKEYGKVETNIDVLRLIIETLDGRPTSMNSKLEMLQGQINTLIQKDPKLFLKVITDKLIPAKVLLKKSVEAGLVAKRGNYYYLRQDNTPLCNNGQEPVFNIAAAYLTEPQHQELKFMLEAKLK